ncbi:MAG: formylglycine-generating enzyme family protein [Acidobacteriota bacterium]|nr:formylglycine-generating enzyme family protein [Acidobacteriota bacterium]
MSLIEPERLPNITKEKIPEQSFDLPSESKKQYAQMLFTPYEIDSKPDAKVFRLVPLAILIVIMALGIGGVILWFDLNSKKPNETTKARIINKSDPATAGKVIKNSVGMELIYIPPGDFIMGSSEDEINKALIEVSKYQKDAGSNRFENETPPRKISIKDGFWMGKYEVTQAQWQAVMNENPSHFKECGANCPVEQVTWDDAQVFVEKLNAENDGLEYRLPTEAEWEYAARAGTTTVFSFGDTLNSSQANFDGNFPYDSTKGKYIARTIVVGSYQPNAFGLYDMHGNAWEWTQDIYNPNYQNLLTDGSANSIVGESNLRVLRGGSWYNSGFYCRSAYRFKLTPNSRSNNVSLRIAALAK